MIKFIREKIENELKNLLDLESCYGLQYCKVDVQRQRIEIKDRIIALHKLEQRKYRG